MIEPNTKEQALERLNFAVRDAVHARRYVFGMPLEPANQNWVRDIEALAYVEKVLLESSGDRPTPPIPPACGQGPQYDAASYQLLAGVRRELSGIKYRPDVKLPDRLGDIPSANEPIQIVFDGPPAPESGRFVEVEQGGKGINFGEWKQREDGYWVLELPLAPPVQTTSGTLTFKMPQATTALPPDRKEMVMVAVPVTLPPTISISTTDGRTCIDSHDKIIRAALKCREGKKAEEEK